MIDSIAGVAARELPADIARGLDRETVARRRAELGPNVLVEARRPGPARLLLAQFADVMVLLLLAAAVVASVVGEAADIVAILVIVVLNAVLGFVQEYRAERALAALRAIAAPSARVRREGVVATIPATELVPGDVVLLEAGNIVPADLVLAELAQLRVDESALTGESQPVDKRTDAQLEAPTDAEAGALGDRVAEAFQGTLVTHGRATGIVTATGMRTQLGRIASLLHQEREVQTPLQKRLAAFSRRLAVVILVVCAGIFAFGFLRGEQPLLMFMTALSLAVAAVPEALPAVVTLGLAFGARKLVRQHALVRRLPAVETLGSVTYICTDKTGTLTENRMRVEALRGSDGARCEAEPGMPPRGCPPLLYEAMAVSNDAVLIGDEPSGDPTEVALCRAAAAAGYAKSTLAVRLPRIAEIPFSAERARMTTLHRSGALVVAFTKGAPERVIESCTDAWTPAEGRAPIDAVALLETADRMARSGLRVLAFAMRRLPDVPDDPEAAEQEQSFLGLVGLMDPPRPEAAEAVSLCQSAGIHVVMITGDHPSTARAIAARLGIASPDSPVITGSELRRVAPGALVPRVAETRVYARVAPEDKIRIVKALQSEGEFVAMTGDGVNDAPALRRANIGIAMGRIGTDVAREAAHMVLLDDNFATIVAAVREGRRIYDNIRKFVRYVLAGNSGEIWLLLLAPVLGFPLPLLPIHILWVNLVTDGLPGLALTAEPAERGVMRRPPRPPDESIFARGLWQHVLWAGLLIGGVSLAVQGWAYRTGDAHWQSMTFTTITLAQMAHVLAIRSERDSLFRLGLWSNRPLLGAVALTFLLQLATLYVPALHSVFRTTTLGPGELAIALAAASLVFFGVELEKWMIRRGWIYR